MCGIAGCVGRKMRPEETQQILARIAHRGPDDAGSFTYQHVWLGNTRLAIQDLSPRGHQPMRSADGRYALVYNGEIYNNQELRKQLAHEGVIFQSASDTETLLQAYIHYGASCLQRLNGIYAFAIYDQLKDELFIARDPLGVKPLYYYQDKDQLLFASELKALSGLTGLDYSIDPIVFYNYLLFLYNPDDRTPFRKIHKLPAGHYIRITEGVPEKPCRHYSIPFKGDYNNRLNKQQWVEELDIALQRSVQKQMISDAPVGTFLSGGLDSSLVAAIAQKATDSPLTCFTIDTGSAFQKEGFQDDLHFARIAAKATGVKLVEVTGNIDIATELDAMVWQLDEPQADPAALHVQHIATVARQHGIKVLLSGTGADDLFSGYRRHQAIRFELLLNNIPGSMLSAGAALANFTGRKNMARRISKLNFSTGNKIQKRISTHFWLQPERVAQLFQSSLADGFSAAYPYQYFEELLTQIPREHDPLNQMLYWEMRTFLPQHNLNYTDKMSMAAGVETRVPYLDTDLIALSAQMPPALKMNNRETKYLLRKVAGKYLPEIIINRKKTGFGAPLRQWINGELKTAIQERLLSGSLEQWNIFSTEAIRQLVADNERGKIDGAYTIFSLLAIESWLRQFCSASIKQST